MYSYISKMLNSNNFWCPYPYSGLCISSSGEYRICCQSYEKTHMSIKDYTTENYFNSTPLQQLRHEMENGIIGPNIKKWCDVCLNTEKYHSNSARKNSCIALRPNVLNSDILSRIDNTIKSSIENKYIYLEDMGFFVVDLKMFGNLCNLRCLMCDPLDNVHIDDVTIKQGTHVSNYKENIYSNLTLVEKNKFDSEIYQILKHTDQCKMVPKEYTINKEAIAFVHTLVENGLSKNLRLLCITNATLYKESIISDFRKFKSMDLMISVDGYGPIQEIQRVGSTFDIVDKNIDKYVNVLNKSNVKISSTATVINCSNIPYLYTYYSKFKKLYWGIGSIVIQPDYLCIDILPNELKEIYLKKIEYIPDNNKLPVVKQMLRTPTEDLSLFKKYLTKMFNWYSEEFIYKYFPEYKNYID